MISIKLQSNFNEITVRHVNLSRIFRTPFPKNTSGWLLLNVIAAWLCTETSIIWWKQGSFHFMSIWANFLLTSGYFDVTVWNLSKILLCIMSLLTTKRKLTDSKSQCKGSNKHIINVVRAFNSVDHMFGKQWCYVSNIIMTLFSYISYTVMLFRNSL